MKAIFLVVVLLTGISYASLGQGCGVCSKTTAGMNDKSADGINNGIIYLGTIPLVILGTIGLIWWRSNKSFQEN